MAWTVYGARIEDEDCAGGLSGDHPIVYQVFTIPRELKLKAIRSWFIFKGAPDFNALYMQVFAMNSGSVPPRASLAIAGRTESGTSGPWVLSDILTEEAHGIKELYFQFTDPIWLRRGTYAIAPFIDGPSFTAQSHIAWMKHFPDPPHETSEELSVANIGRIPFNFALIGSDFGP